MALVVGYFVDRQVVIRHLRAEVESEKHQITEIRREASTDLLTMLPGLNNFCDRLAMEFRRASNTQQPLSLLAVELKPSRAFTDPGEIETAFGVVLEDGRLMIAIADAADKGISACLFSLSFRSMLRTAVAILKDLSNTVYVANTLLMRDTSDTSFFITAWIGIYNPQTHELSYCSQGHPPAYVRKESGELIELSASGIALGVESVLPKIEKIRLNEGDLLFLYTDGVIEAIDTDHQFFGKERLKEFLSRSKKNEPQAIVDQLLEEIHLFSGGASQSDDLTLLAIGLKSFWSVNT